MNIQFKKGVLKLCVLSLLNNKDCYGYELVSSVSEHINISEGTIYPLLKKFRDEGFVETYIEESTSGPARKYYSLSDKGRDEYNVLYSDWEVFSRKVSSLLNGGVKDE